MQPQWECHLGVGNAFADDMDSKTATIEVLQRKADIVSAFCILFNVNMSILKLRRVSMHWQHKKEYAAETSSYTHEADR